MKPPVIKVWSLIIHGCDVLGELVNALWTVCKNRGDILRTSHNSLQENWKEPQRQKERCFNYRLISKSTIFKMIERIFVMNWKSYKNGSMKSTKSSQMNLNSIYWTIRVLCENWMKKFTWLWISKIFRDKFNDNPDHVARVDIKLRRKILEKEEAHGIKHG